MGMVAEQVTQLGQADSGCLGALRHGLANLGCCSNGGTTVRTTKVGFGGRCRRNRATGIVVDQLHGDVLVAAVNGKTRTLGRAVHLLANAAVTAQTRMVFIANPNNPTGTLLRSEELLRFLRAVPASVIVVLDEAYNEYLEPALKTDSIGWLAQFPNLVVTRTFSKAYGLAGLRVGYALGHPDVIDLMNRVRQPFNVNSISLAAAAAALEDHDFVRRSYELNATGMRQITQGLDKLGLSYIPSFGNFISVNVGDAAKIFQQLLRRGVIVRPVAGYGMPSYLRVSIGLESENARFLAALEESLRGG